MLTHVYTCMLEMVVILLDFTFLISKEEETCLLLDENAHLETDSKGGS